MKTTNLPSGAHRQANVGLVWEEVLSGATGTFRVYPLSTIRVRATGATTVTVDGVLAMTMSSGEIEYFNAGTGVAGDTRTTVEIEIAAANAFVQVAREIETGRREK